MSSTRLALAILTVVGVLGIAAPAHAISDITAVTVDGDPGDFVGKGETLVITSADSTVSGHGTNSVSFIYNQGVGGHYWDATLEPPIGQSFVAGTTYPANRFADATHAGLSVALDSLGCNHDNGTLTILEIAFAPMGGEVTALAASYVQHCEGAAPAIYGDIRFHSSIDYHAFTKSVPSLDYGTSTPSTKSVTITNAGNVTLPLGPAVIAGPQSGDYAVTTDTCSSSTLALSASCSVSVKFTRIGNGGRAAELSFAAATPRGKVAIPLYGEGPFLQTHVTLKTSRTKVALHGSVKVTAHLADYGSTVGNTLNIMQTSNGSAQALVKSGAVSGSGDFSVTLKLTRTTVFVATFDSDGTYAGATSASKKVGVVPVVSGRLVKFYKSSGRYKLYHYRGTCPTTQAGCPSYVISMSPNHGGDVVNLTVELFSGGRWRTTLRGVISLLSNSKQGVVIYYNNQRVIGVPLRVRITFPGDGDNLKATSAWSYFKVTG